MTWIVIWALKPQAGCWKSVKLGKLRENHQRLPRVGPPLLPLHEVHFILRWLPSRGWKRQGAVWQENQGQAGNQLWLGSTHVRWLR